MTETTGNGQSSAAKIPKTVWESVPDHGSISESEANEKIRIHQPYGLEPKKLDTQKCAEQQTENTQQNRHGKTGGFSLNLLLGFR